MDYLIDMECGWEHSVDGAAIHHGSSSNLTTRRCLHILGVRLDEDPSLTSSDRYVVRWEWRGNPQRLHYVIKSKSQRPHYLID